MPLQLRKVTPYAFCYFEIVGTELGVTGRITSRIISRFPIIAPVSVIDNIVPSESKGSN